MREHERHKGLERGESSDTGEEKVANGCRKLEVIRGDKRGHLAIRQRRPRGQRKEEDGGLRKVQRSPCTEDKD